MAMNKRINKTMSNHVYIKDVRQVMSRLDSDYSLKKLSKRENRGFSGYQLIVYQQGALNGKNIIRDLTRLGLIFVSKRTNKEPFAEVYLFNF